MRVIVESFMHQGSMNIPGCVSQFFLYTKIEVLIFFIEENLAKKNFWNGIVYINAYILSNDSMLDPFIFLSSLWFSHLHLLFFGDHIRECLSRIFIFCQFFEELDLAKIFDKNLGLERITFDKFFAFHSSLPFLIVSSIHQMNNYSSLFEIRSFDF